MFSEAICNILMWFSRITNPNIFNIISCAYYILNSGLKSYTFYNFALYALLRSLGTLLFYPQHRRLFYKFLRFQSRSMQECKRAELLELFLCLHLSHRTAALTPHSNRQTQSRSRNFVKGRTG